MGAPLWINLSEVGKAVKNSINQYSYSWYHESLSYGREESILDNILYFIADILNSEIKPSDPIALQKAKGVYRACTDSEFQNTRSMLHPEIGVRIII